ncbi:hypothetical protein RSP795_19090 [Ralstonia solanacearum]|uniref:hypothetical protein n=1 Tax=Ralstonia solanacearum TaxID=305 RepID=UPI0007D86F73|nr:hypothetical protein [Ralstonia solanacearum]OAI59998.1 hypothetical protein RSP795_19090 [Ralstonia solanacearum]
MVIDLKQYFRDEADFSPAFERLPFAKHDTLALRWGNWLVRVSYEAGDHVKADSATIQAWLGERVPRNSQREIDGSGSCLGVTRNGHTRTRCFT